MTSQALSHPQDETVNPTTGAVATVTLSEAEQRAIEYAELTLRCESHPMCEMYTAILRDLIRRYGGVL